MKLLLDENLPHQLRHELPGHDCYTVAFMGWAGLENGTLLARAASAGFDALLTKDAKLQYEQTSSIFQFPLSCCTRRRTTLTTCGRSLRRCCTR